MFDLNTIDQKPTLADLGFEEPQDQAALDAAKAAEEAAKAQAEADAAKAAADAADPDGEEDDDETEEEKAEREAEEARAAAEAEEAAQAAKPAKKEAGIPRPRFNKVNEERNALKEAKAALEAKIERMASEMEALKNPQKQEPAAPAYNFAEKEAEAANLIYLGKSEEYAALRSEIDEKRMAIAEARAFERAKAEYDAREAERLQAQAERQRQAEQADADAAAAQAMAKYPYLDPDSEEHNEDALDFVITKRDKLIAQGLSPKDAILQAADAFAALSGKAAPAPAPAPAKPSKAQQRMSAALDAHADASTRQPADPSSVGLGHRAAPSGLDPSKMSPLDFARLTQEQREEILRNS